MSTESIQAKLGHSSPRVTEAYLEAMKDEEIRSIEADLKHSSLRTTGIYLEVMGEEEGNVMTQNEMIAELTKSTRKAQGLTMEQFGAALVEQLPGVETSKQAVQNWESGRQTPAYLFLVGIVRTYGDWRHDWGLSSLEALRPDLWVDQQEKQNEGA